MIKSLRKDTVAWTVATIEDHFRQGKKAKGLRRGLLSRIKQRQFYFEVLSISRCLSIISGPIPFTFVSSSIDLKGPFVSR